MRVAVDPFMLRDHPIETVFETVAEVGYPWLELSPRHDLLPLWVGRRAADDAVGRVLAASRRTGVGVASVWVVYRWSSPDADERAAAMRYWAQAIDLTVEMRCDRMNTELSGDPARPGASEAALWQSLDALVPRLESEGITLAVEPHPGDFTEDGRAALALIRGVRSPALRYLHCAPHTFHLGHDPMAIIGEAGPVLAHVHLADTVHPGRIIVNPPDARVSVHQHLDLGEGEVDLDGLFAALAATRFDGVLTTSVFFQDERATASFAHNLATVRRLARAAGLALAETGSDDDG